ncbi:MAG: gliding motility-associated C-terminal domain-containing protein [Chitinophagaceae bacterium]|nr:gliding motility-associated C-terminal domain-containing protein [Chitinophagaceae bacterium]
MKRYIITYLLLISTLCVLAQKQANTWYFGNRVGLDFNYSPPLALNNGEANSFEGTASISDNNGKLLFYTNGNTVQNRRHDAMPNGIGLRGDISSTDNAVIVPMPGNDSMYYIFTIGSAMEEEPVFCYSIVDMKADGGYGDVIVKNILIKDSVLEKMAAIRHCNKRDTWIVIQHWKTDEYYAYLLTPSGLNSPVISSTGFILSGTVLNSIGTLKFSSKGNKLAACHAFDNDAVQLMDFDNTTGVISNSLVFYPNAIPHQNSYTGVYGAEFSPDGRLLYISANNSVTDPSTLYQFDITSNNAATILASKQIIAQTAPWFAGDLQLAPDQKIYFAMWKDTSISVIENPNTIGPGCNFIFNKIYLGPENSNPVQFGLPTFLQSYFDSTSNPYDFGRTGNCTDLSVSFLLSRLSGIDSVKWDFGDGQQSQVLQPTHTYTAPGFYDVNLIVYKIDCSGLYDTINRKIWIADSGEFLGADTSSCNLLTMEIGVDVIIGVNYLWNTGFTGSKITTTGFGDYWLEMEQNGCKVRDTIKVSPRPKPTVGLGADTSICRYKPVVLSTASSNYDSYLWSTGETTPTILVNQAGTYSVTVLQNSCEATDSIRVSPGDCDVYIPSAFTPNGDNVNETFGVIDNVAVQYFSMQIYNKWGQLIFISNDIAKKWDGTYKGKQVPNGAYIWMMTYVNRSGRKFYEQGTVMLIR